MPRLAFGPYVLDTASRRLWHDKTPLELAPRPFDVLTVLAERAGQLVEKAEILGRVWGSSDVPDNALSVAMARVRAALGTEGRSCIETVSGYGYRFAWPVQTEAPKSMAGVETVALGAIRALSPAADSIAEGLGGALASALSGLGVSTDPAALAELVADVDVTGDRARLHLRIKASGQTLWGRSVTTPAEPTASARRTLAATAAEAVSRRLDAAARARAAGVASSIPPPSYHDARFSIARGTPQHMAEAMAGFEAATEADPSFAPAWSGIAEVALWQTTALGVPAHETFPRARRAAELALDLDPDASAPLVSLAHIAWRYDWDVDEAERLFGDAIARAPESDARGGLAALLAHTGRVDEAMALGTDIPASPHTLPLRLDFGMAGALGGQPEAAEHHLEAVLALAPEHPLARIFLAHVRDTQGDAEAAIAEAERGVRSGGTHPLLLGVLAGFLARAGRTDEAQALTAETARHPATEALPTSLALAPAALGDTKAALDALRRAVEVRDPLLIHVPVWHFLDPIRPAPAFQALVWRIGLPTARASPISGSP